MATHAIAVQGPGGTAALSTTQIGATQIMPAGGPWIIHHIWGQVVKNTTVPNEGTGGAMIIRALSGDLDPDPAPGTYPLVGTPASDSANCSVSAVPLNLFPVNWNASGKASLAFYYLNQLAITTASEVAMGIIFGDTIPEQRPLKFCDGVRSAFASALEQTIGTITLAEKATRIVGIFADLNHGDAITAGEECMALVRLDSADIKLPPAQYPCCRAFNASDGTAVGQAGVPQSQFIPVDIPVEGGARINCYAQSSISVTGNCEVQVYLAYE